jgi:hypothetical protein
MNLIFLALFFLSYNAFGASRLPQNVLSSIEFSSSFNPKDNFSDEITFEVPKEVKSMQIEAYTADAHAAPVVSNLYRVGANQSVVEETLITDVVGPEIDKDRLRQILSFTYEPGPFLSRNRSMYLLNGYCSAFVPNNPSVQLTPGIWKVRLKNIAKGISNSQFTLRVVFKSPHKKIKKRVLPLHFYFSGQSGWTAKNFKDKNVDMHYFLFTLQDIFANAGIEIEVASVNDLKTNAQNQIDMSIIDSTEKVNQLLGRDKAEKGIKLYFLQSVFGGLGGYTSGVGGPTLSSKNTFGGIVLSSLYINYPTILAITAAHEIGHYLGLYHVKESGTLIFDQILDTDAASNSVSYIMEATAPSDPNQLRVFSPEQSQVMFGHPAIIEVP